MNWCRCGYRKELHGNDYECPLGTYTESVTFTTGRFPTGYLQINALAEPAKKACRNQKARETPKGRARG